MKIRHMAQRRLRRFLAVIGLSLPACRRDAGPPFSPEKELATFRIEEGFAIGLAAAEPEVASPVALDFDEDGRMFVVEMPGYPLDTRPTGRIRLLEDQDGDGRPERSTVFAEGLVLPTGVMRHRRGILVTAAPDVWYLADEDGDGRAERREKVLTGFAFSNPQHTVNSPVYGLDNWIYLAHEGPAGAVIYRELFGDKGSEIRFPDEPGSPSLAAGRHGVRFRPDTFELEALSGSSQFGHAFDEWGRHFTLDNSNHLRHEVIAARYLKRNPHLPVGTSMHDVSDHGSNAKVFAITKRPRFELLTEPGEFTSACGLAFYLGGALPAEAGRTSFVAEPAQNLVHRDVWSEAGSTFTARRAKEGVEFLASTDSWFRPVYMTAGPDGALYLVDYYRRMIEHPEWASTQVHAHEKEMYAGQDRGRIWRITASGRSPTAVKKASLGSASDEELVAALASENAWWRRTAQRLLVEGRRAGAVSRLVRLYEEDRSALGRLHALWTLEGLGRLEDALVEKALSDPEAGVRENAVRLAEPRLRSRPALLARVLALVDDPSPKVRFQLLCTLGGVDTAASRAAQDRLLRRDLEDEWVQVAALSAPPEQAARYLEAALAPGALAGETPGQVAFLRRAAEVIGARQAPGEVGRVLKVASDARGPKAEAWRNAVLQGVARGAQARGTLDELRGSPGPLLDLAFDAAPGIRRAALRLLAAAGVKEGPGLEAWRKRAEALAGDAGAPADRRADAVRLLGLCGPERQKELLLRLVDPREPEDLQAAAVQALGRIPPPRAETSREAAEDAIGAFLIARWRSLTAPVRSEAAEALLAEPGRTRLLVAALQKGDVQAWTLSFWQKRDLIMNDEPEIRARARPLLESPPEEREKVLKGYEKALELSGDARRGEQVFDRACAKCHRLDGRGAEIGPDLGSVRNRAPSLLLADILVPSRSIAQGYESYVVETASGDMLEGLIAAQSPSAIVLRREGGEDRVVPRASIEKIYASNLSAMPADLEEQVGVQEMADLIARLGGGHRPRRSELRGEQWDPRR